QCHPPVPTHLCPPVPPTCAHPPVLPTSATHQCSPAVLPVSATISAVYQYPSSVSPIRDTSLVLPISAAYPCHLISTAYQCPLVLPISAHHCCLSVPISAASSTHISEGEKLPV
ncbi:unnamed protein product, partial [Staurois parvus]